MSKRQKLKRSIGNIKQINRARQAADKKEIILSRLGEKERNLYECLHASLIPNDYGIAASVVQHPVSRLWQGWISNGSALVFISARKDMEQAYVDVEELLELAERDDFSFEDALRLWANFNIEDDLPPEELPEHISKGLLFFIRLIYEIES